MSQDILKKEVKSGTIRNIYLFYGEEDYLKEVYCRRIEDIVLDDSLKDLNKVVLHEEKDISKIIDICETMPCFSEKKIVILKNSSFFKATKKDGKNKKEDLEMLIKNVPPYTCLIFCETEVDKRLKVVKEVEKKGLVVEFKLQPVNILVKWIAGELKKKGKAITVDTATKLVEYGESSMFSIQNEINKLCLYVEDRQEITDNDIEEICTKPINVRIFDLIDNIALQNEDMALKNLKEMIILKEPIPKIMFMIIKHIKQLLEMKTLQKEGVVPRDCVTIMKIAPYTATKLSNQIRKFEEKKLKIILEEMLELDYKVKIGEIRDILAVEIVITKLCQNS